MPLINNIPDSQLGTINLTTSSRARYINFRCKNGRITMTIPATSNYTLDDLRNKIDEFRPKLLKMLARSQNDYKQALLYEGKIIDFVEGRIIIKSESKIPKRSAYICHKEGIEWALYNPEDSFMDESFAHFFSKAILKFITQRYGHRLQQLALQCAQTHNITIKEVRIGRGKQRLGSCTQSGIITLSAALILYPQHLREYIIYHELAHLKHFNHSPAFHQLCDKYCMGKEKQWNEELKKFTLPICL